MADFFSNIFDSLTGQQAIPQATILDPSQLYGQALATQAANLPALNSYNTQLANDLGGQQRTYLGSRYGDQFNTLQDNTTKSFLDNLNLGTSLSPELTADITRKLFESGAASGFGYSPAGRGQVALQTGLQADALGRQRRLDAANYGQGLGQSVNTFQPMQGVSTGGLMDAFQQQQAAKDNLANVQEQMRQDNFSSLLNTGTRIAGAVAGGFFGGPMGAVAGASAGNSVFGRAKGGGSFGSGGTGLLSSFGNMFSGQPNSIPAVPVDFSTVA